MLKDKRRKRHSEIKAKAQHCLSPCFSPTDDPRLQRPFISHIASVIASAILDKRTLYSRLRLVFRYRGIITRYLSIVLDIAARSRNVLIAGSTPACSISCRVDRCRFRHGILTRSNPFCKSGDFVNRAYRARFRKRRRKSAIHERYNDHLTVENSRENIPQRRLSSALFLFCSSFYASSAKFPC